MVANKQIHLRRHPDPAARQPAGLDRYGYAYNNPVIHNEPSRYSGKFFEMGDPQELVLTPL